LAEQRPDFSGFSCYETEFFLYEVKPLFLEISDAAEGVEVFVNRKSAGIEIVPPFNYDLSALVQRGHNTLSIEVATTVEREWYANYATTMEKMRSGEPVGKSGLTGNVRLIY